jgi:hypothetical protein
VPRAHRLWICVRVRIGLRAWHGPLCTRS